MVSRGRGPRLGQFALSLGALAVAKQYGVVLHHAKYNIKHAGIKGYEKARMQIVEMWKI